MARFELNIYGEDDAIVKGYGTNIIPWGVFIRAASLQDGFEEKSAFEQMRAVGDLLKCVFTGLTDEELEHASSDDVMNVFTQIINSGNKINAPKNG